MDGCLEEVEEVEEVEDGGGRGRGRVVGHKLVGFGFVGVWREERGGVL